MRVHLRLGAYLASAAMRPEKGGGKNRSRDGDVTRTAACDWLQSGLTPLHVAAFMGHMNILLYLIQHGAGVDTTTVRGETALHLAARANQTDVMRILLRNGAQVDARARVGIFIYSMSMVGIRELCFDVTMCEQAAF